MQPFRSRQGAVARRVALAGVSALVLAVAAEAARADNLLVGTGGQGADAGIARGGGGGGGIGGGGGSEWAGGGGGIGGGMGWSSSSGGAGGSGSPGSAAGGAGGSSNGRGGDGNIGGGGGGTSLWAGGGGGAIGAAGGAGGNDGGSLPSGGNGGSNGGGGGGASSSSAGGADGADGTNGLTTAEPSGSMTISGSSPFDFVGVGGGGGGAAVTSGGNGTGGVLTINGGGDLTVSRSLLIGGAGGGGSRFAVGGSGGSGTVSVVDGSLSVAETLLVGGSGGGGGGTGAGGGGADGGAGGAGVLTVGGGTSVTIEANGHLILGGANGGGSSVRAGGAGGTGTLNLAGTLVFASGADFTIRSGSALNIGNATADAAAGGTISGLSTIANDGAVNFNQSDPSYTLGVAISGSGSVNQNSSGTTVLTGANSYTGGTTVNAGILRAGNASAFAQNTAYVVNGGQLQLNGFNLTASALSGAGGLVDLGAADLTVNQSTATSFAGSITGAGNLTKQGAGTLGLSGTNTFMGTATVSGGVLRISSNGALGTGAAGTIVEAGAALEILGGITTPEVLTLSGTGVGGNGALRNISGDNTLTGAITLGADARIQADAGSATLAGPVNTAAHGLTFGGNGSIVVAGAIGGTGSLTKDGAGTLTLLGNNTYAGGTAVNSGTLVLNASTAAGTGAITLAGGATLGFASGIDVANAIVLNGTANVDLASGTATASGALSGSGALAFTGGGLISLTGNSSGFTGTATVETVLSINGGFGGTINVASGGVLKGNGTVGPTTIAAGGTIAPGNSIGTLMVNGAYTQAAGSTYQVEINPAGQSDLIVVNGAASLNGNVSVVKAPGNYAAGTRYIILTATSINGAFAELAQDMPFLTLTLGYTSTAVYLDVNRNAVTFARIALDPNSVSTANAVEALGQGNPVYDAVANQTSVASANAAFNALSGEVYPSALSILQSESVILRRAVLDRARAPVAPVATAPLSYATKAQAGPFTAGADVLDVPGTPNAFWAQAFGAWNKIDGNGNAASISGDTGGVFVGYDRTFSGAGADWRLGFAAGYSSSSYQVDARSSSFSSDNIHLALYGGASFGALGIRFGGTYSWADIDASRTVAFPGFLNSLTADTSARTGQVFGEVGYGIPLAAANLEPFAGLAYVNVDMDGFTEVGGPAALTTSGPSQGVTYSTLGARVSVPLALGTVATRLTGTLAWQHAFGDTTPEAQLAFATGSSPFAISGVPVATDAALVEAGLDMSFAANTSLSVFYAGQLADTATTNMVKGTFTLKF